MPGGQYTNLREQARSMGLEHRWNEVAQAYADVNQLFGDIVKVTPSSKVVGDMALFMVANDLTPDEVSADPAKDIAFPESVVSMMRGELGYPADGFPSALQAKVLKGQRPSGRVGAHLPSVDLEAKRAKAAKAVGQQINDTDLASWLMYPKVFTDYAEHVRKYGDVSVLPTPVFFYGLPRRTRWPSISTRARPWWYASPGRTAADDEGELKLFFELNGQPRPMRFAKVGQEGNKRTAKAEEGNGSMSPRRCPGRGATVAVKAGPAGAQGHPLLSIEAMKMETLLTADADAVISPPCCRRKPMSSASTATR
jgi:pyruvate carboxylase